MQSEHNYWNHITCNRAGVSLVEFILSAAVWVNKRVTISKIGCDGLFNVLVWRESNNGVIDMDFFFFWWEKYDIFFRRRLAAINYAFVGKNWTTCFFCLLYQWLFYPCEKCESNHPWLAVMSLDWTTEDCNNHHHQVWVTSPFLELTDFNCLSNGVVAFPRTAGSHL